MRRCLLFLALLPYPCWGTETLSDLITTARVLALDASSPTRQRFTDAQITSFINDGQRDAISTTHCLMQSMSFQLSAGTTYYALPSNFVGMERVTIGKLNATEMTEASLDGRSRGWEASSGHPTYYFISFSSRGYMGFAPWPATTSDTDTIKIEYDIQATDLAIGTDIPYNGVGELTDYHTALAYFAAGLMTAIEGLNTQAQLYMAMYKNEVDTMQKRCRERVNYLPSAGGSP